MADFQKLYKKECRKQNIDYVPVVTDQSLDLALTGYLKKRKKVS